MIVTITSFYTEHSIYRNYVTVVACSSDAIIMREFEYAL
jgi:hypothetical protein